MFAKDWRIGLLLDFYGEVLQDRTREVLTQYYDNDLSLAEIAETQGISRQGVRHLIKKGEEQLFFFEEKLGLFGDYRALRASAEELLSVAKELAATGDTRLSSIGARAKGAAEKILSRE